MWVPALLHGNLPCGDHPSRAPQEGRRPRARASPRRGRCVLLMWTSRRGKPTSRQEGRVNAPRSPGGLGSRLVRGPPACGGEPTEGSAAVMAPSSPAAPGQAGREGGGRGRSSHTGAAGGGRQEFTAQDGMQSCAGLSPSVARVAAGPAPGALSVTAVRPRRQPSGSLEKKGLLLTGPGGHTARPGGSEVTDHGEGVWNT